MKKDYKIVLKGNYTMADPRTTEVSFQPVEISDYVSADTVEKAIATAKARAKETLDIDNFIVIKVERI